MLWRLRPAADLLSRVSTSASAPSILHLGCADGAVSQLLRERWPQAPVRCVDGSASALAKAEERLARPAEFVCEGVASVVERGGSESFDLIFADVALEVLPSPADALEALLARGVHRATRTGASLGCT